MASVQDAAGLWSERYDCAHGVVSLFKAARTTVPAAGLRLHQWSPTAMRAAPQSPREATFV
jgi:hypothetical protein